MSMTPDRAPRPREGSRPRGRWRPAHAHPPAAAAAGPGDDVLDAGLDSFPASDPPSSSSLRAGAPAA